jgi:cytochrome b involved in lipid metabolism
VIRGARPASPATSASPAASATPTPSATPSPTPTATATATPAGYTMADVKKANSRTKCWTAISGSVYDLTPWISAHPGGAAAITFLCGTDGTNAYKAQHEGQSRPALRLTQYLLGPLTP